jgi:hypothetical protein
MFPPVAIEPTILEAEKLREVILWGARSSAIIRAKCPNKLIRRCLKDIFGLQTFLKAVHETRIVTTVESIRE